MLQCLSNGAVEAFRRADCAVGPHSEKVLWEDETEYKRRNVRAMCFNTAGRQNSPERGRKTQRGKPGQNCVSLYQVFPSSVGKGPLFCALRGASRRNQIYANAQKSVSINVLSDDDQ